MRNVTIKLHSLKLTQGQFQPGQIYGLIQGFSLVKDDAASPIQSSPVLVFNIKLLLNSYSLLSPPQHQLTSQDKGFLHKGSGSCIQVPAIWSEGKSHNLCALNTQSPNGAAPLLHPKSADLRKKITHRGNNTSRETCRRGGIF